MQTITRLNNIEKIDVIKRGMSVPASLKPAKLIYSAETDDFMDFISSQHPLINVWLVFSLFSIGLLSVLLFVI